METTTDFSAWLSCLDLTNYEEIYSLYRSVADCDEYGMYSTQVANGVNNGWIVKATFLDDALHIASDKAKHMFLSIIAAKYFNGMDLEGWYAYMHAMEKDD